MSSLSGVLALMLGPPVDGRVIVQVRVAWVRRPEALLVAEGGEWYLSIAALEGLRPVPV